MSYSRIALIHEEPGAIYQTDLDGWLEEGWELIEVVSRGRSVGNTELDQIVFILGLPKPQRPVPNSGYME